MRALYVSAALITASGFAAPASAERPIAFAAAPVPGGALVLPLGAAGDMQARGAALDPATRESVVRALAAARWDTSVAETLSLRGIGPWSRILIVRTGKEPPLGAALQDAGGIAARELAGEPGPVNFIASGWTSTVPSPAAQIAVGARLGGYSFDKYKYADPAKPRDTGLDAPFTIVTPDVGAAEAYTQMGAPLADAVRFARDLVTEPANVIYPETFIERTRGAFAGVLGVSIDVLDVPAMERLGMGSILSVGRGSARPPRMLIVRYRGQGAPERPIVMAGKGITFDSGGISLKPGAGMWEMKGDMAGAAAVVGAALSLAKSRAPANVVAIAALAENMPGSRASRPGDVVKAYNGKTIEILNTDAEGRLVLADAVSYGERQYRPAAIVDLATLTGSKVTALGDEYAGLFSRHDGLAQQLLAAGEGSGELLWRLPLHPNHAKDMNSDIADIKNVVEGGGPGASLGAHFIGYFVDGGTPWAHLDIAGNEMISGPTATSPAGATGFGVRLLDRFVRNFVPAAAAARP